MSDDKTIIHRRGGVDRFFYDRHGGSCIDRMLLGGLARVQRDLTHLRPTPAPFFERWMSGVALIDEDAQRVSYWSCQYLARSGLEHRLLHRLIASVWPGWTLQWMVQPAMQLARLLPDTPPVRCLEPMRPTSADAFAALQHEAWDHARAEGDLGALIAEFGEATVRGWMEYQTHDAAVCIVTPDGVHEVALNDRWDSTALLSTGPDAVAVLLGRAHQPHEAHFSEPDIRGAYWIDPGARTLWLWHGRPSWSDGVPGSAWDGWRIAVMPGGPQELMQRLGRDPRALLDSDNAHLRKLVERLLPEGTALRHRADALLEEAGFQPLDGAR